MPIEFRKIVVSSRFSPPDSGGAESSQEIEYRMDPLTGRWCRLNVVRARRPRQVSVDTSAIGELAERARASCPFCPEAIEKSTPTYTQLPYKRLKRGDCWVFPNLFPFSKHHSVTVFTREHFKTLDQITADELMNGLNASLEYLRDVAALDPAARYWLLCWNNQPPAGASILHPHLQVLADEKPANTLQQEIEASEKYSREGSCYWGDLIEVEEERGERMVKHGERVAWIASYAPLGNREAIAIFKGISSLSRLAPSDVEEFCKGLMGVTRYYVDAGFTSLNLAFYSGPSDSDISKYFYLHARIVARPSPTPIYVNDDGFLEKLFLEPVIDATPEDLAASLRKYMP
ncbi:MAG: hypothetical protein QXW60_04315 [Nitrososphaerota archaeon]